MTILKSEKCSNHHRIVHAWLDSADGHVRELGRVHTMAMPVVTEVQDLFRAVDGGATLTLLAKLAMEKACTSKLDDTRNAIQVLPSLVRPI